jgi:uncharacterized protein (DUF302 family)
MGIRQVEVQRFSLVSGKSIDDVMASLDGAVGHPDIRAFFREVASAKTTADLETLVGEAVGPTGLMEFARFDMGAILRMYHGEKAPRCFRLLIGNPLIMKQMAEHVPDAAAYAPVTILIDERSDGVHVSYDRVASFLAPYGNAAALKVAQDLDAKIEGLLAEACN